MACEATPMDETVLMPVEVNLIDIPNRFSLWLPGVHPCLATTHNFVPDLRSCNSWMCLVRFLDYLVVEQYKSKEYQRWQHHKFNAGHLPWVHTSRWSSIALERTMSSANCQYLRLLQLFQYLVTSFCSWSIWTQYHLWQPSISRLGLTKTQCWLKSEDLCSMVGPLKNQGEDCTSIGGGKRSLDGCILWDARVIQQVAQGLMVWTDKKKKCFPYR